MRSRSFVTFLAALWLLEPALAQTSEFSEFRIPRHTWAAWNASFQGTATSDDRTDPSSTSDQQDLAAHLSSSANWNLDSDALQLGVLLGLTTQANRRFAQSVLEYRTGQRTEDASSSRTTGEGVRFGGIVRAYPWSAPVGLSLRISGAATWEQNWYDLTRFTLDAPARSKAAERRSVNFRDSRGEYNATATVGYGRVRDASGVYQAHLLERRLLETGALSRALSKSARERVAALYTIRPAYYAPHDRPDRFFWRDLEGILREDGALAREGLDAYSVHRVLERYSVGRTTFLRFAGFHFGPTVSADHTRIRRHSSERTEAGFFVADTLVRSTAFGWTSRRLDSPSLIRAGLAAEYHLPLGMRAQIDLASTALFPTLKKERGLLAYSSASLDYSLSDRFAAGIGVDHSRTIRRQGLPHQESSWGVRFGAALDYYLEDRLYLSLSLSDQRYESSSAKQHRRDRGVFLGFSYSLLGRLDADGLIVPMRRLSSPPPGY